MNQFGSKDNQEKKILIAYYTRTGNTEIFAQVIQEFIGGDLFRIEPVNKYPESYQETLKVSKIEIDNHQKPQIKRQVETIEKYNVVLVGTPNWYSTMAPPVATFLTQHNLSQKIVIPFATHGGGGEARCLTDIGKLCINANVLRGLVIYGSLATSSKETILTWLKNLQIFNISPI
jgi:flavodoxin